MEEERVVLLVAPVGMRDTPEYWAACTVAEERHPDKRLIPDAKLWSTTREFRKTYKKWLDSFVVTNLYILTAPDGTVGWGIFAMWRYLTQHQQSRTIALFPTGGEEFEEIEECQLSKISTDTARYAVPVVGTSAPST